MTQIPTTPMIAGRSLTEAATGVTSSPGMPGSAGYLGAPLPAWPVLGLYFFLPVYWLAGLTPFVTVMLAAVMAAYLLMRAQITWTTAFFLFSAFVLWVGVSGTMVRGLGSAIGYLHSLSHFVAMAILLVYVANARERITFRAVHNSFAFLWVVVAVLGFTATLIPDWVFTTPIGLILPDPLVRNELVGNWVFPRMAEVQMPWGATEPFNRPSAPFPYTNSWGIAYLAFFPSAVMVWWRFVTTKRFALAGGLLAICGVSMIAVRDASNRGMLIGFGILAVYLCVRWLGRGRVLAAAIFAGVCAVAVVSALSLGVLEAIEARQEVSQTTTGRAEVYRLTWEGLQESPLIGLATPKVDPTVNIALGSQGYAWTLLYCYGVIGFALFAIFAAYVIVVGWNVPDEALPLHGVFIALCVCIGFYGLGPLLLATFCLLAAMLTTRPAPLGPADQGPPRVGAPA